ncbi:MAG: dihydroorotase [Candidatus Gastranaerophilales bacterium]|nr:dihydroorotase [Candidatus Gastranaerophilales bacterium]
MAKKDYKITQIPSLIDMHVHFREPGFTYKETIETGIASARAGGFAGVCTMPNTSPVTDNPNVIKQILEKAKKYKFEIYPIAAITKNLDSLELVDFKELKTAGAIGFSNDGLPLLDKDVFLKALKSEELILSHCENESSEVSWQIEMFAKAKEEGFKPRLHFCHISKKESIDLIRNAKKQGLKITAETAPHYFTFTRDDIDTTGRYKMNPALGSEIDKRAVMAGLLDGTIDVIATDHAPHSDEEKLKPYLESPNGITGLETAFSLSYELLGLEKTLEKMAYNPRRILGINNKKMIKVALEEEWIVAPSQFKTKCKISPYKGMKLKGIIIND